MIAPRLGDPDFDDDVPISNGWAIPTLVSLHFIRSALRRRWAMCALSGVLGLLMAAAFLLAFPPSHSAKATLALAHDPQVDPSAAMSTDGSLLRTRIVATRTIANLGLTTSPDDFLKSVTAEPVGSEILSLTLIAPTDAEAVRRLNALISIYLDFRAEQLSMQSNALVSGIQQRIQKLESEVEELSGSIERASSARNSSASKLSDTIAQRAHIQGQIETLQQSLEDATLRNTSVVSASRVIDPAAAEDGAAKRRTALALASGLIAGVAFGCGTVLFIAITSDRLRRRSDIASALEVPVLVSIGRIAPLSRRWLWLPRLRTLDRRRAEGRERLASAIAKEFPRRADLRIVGTSSVPGRWGRLAVACIDNADEVRFAAATAAKNLEDEGCSVALVDLTEHGSLAADVEWSLSGTTVRSTVLRPRGMPALAGDAADLRAVGYGDEDGSPHWPLLTDVTVVLADLDPLLGADHLKAWTDRVIVVVTAGHSSAERIRTVAELVRNAGLDLRFGVVLHTERTDDSSGALGVDPSPTPVQIRDGHQQSESAGLSKSEVR